MTSPAVPALTVTAVVGLAAGALWGHWSLASQAGQLPAPRPTVTLVRSVPVPAPTARSAAAQAVARTTAAGAASPRVAPATQSVVRQVRSQPRRPAARPTEQHKHEPGKSGGKKADGHHGAKGEKEDHHRARGKGEAGKDARREHRTAPQRSHSS